MPHKRKQQPHPKPSTPIDPRLDDALREMYGDEVEELVALGILPEDLGDQ